MDGTAVWHLSKGKFPQGGQGARYFYEDGELL